MPAIKKRLRKILKKTNDTTNDTSTSSTKLDTDSSIGVDDGDNKSPSTSHVNVPKGKLIVQDTEDENQQHIVSKSIRDHDDDCSIFEPPNEQWQSDATVDIGIPYPTIRINYNGINTPLVQNSFATHNIFGDGSCYFRCISYVLFGTEDHHIAIRRTIVEYMKLHKDRVMQYMNNPRTPRDRFLTQSELFDRHIEYMSNPGSDPKHWGTQMEIIATASLLRTDIHVYHISGGHRTKNPTWSWHKYKSVTLLGETSEVARDCSIYLHNTRSNHYDVVTASTSAGLPNTSTVDSRNEDQLASNTRNGKTKKLN